MKLSEGVIIYNDCEAFRKMLEGFELIILNAPDSDKKEMLKDIIKHGKKLSKSYQSHINSNQIYQWKETCYDGLLDIEKRKNKEKDIKIEKLENQIKEMLK